MQIASSIISYQVALLRFWVAISSVKRPKKWQYNASIISKTSGTIAKWQPPSPLSSNHKTLYNSRILRKLDEIRRLKPDSPTINTETAWRKQISLLYSKSFYRFMVSRIFWVTDFLVNRFFDFPFHRKVFRDRFYRFISRKLNENRNL